MSNPTKTQSELAKIDLVLIGAALALVVVGVLLALLSPAWWGWYLWVLDVRVWPPWKCIGAAVIVVQSVLVIWYWPDK